ncbi:hypothetical protein MRB53_023212 [Persea americana]|uniref:Uncharacterized protein n=1 Tax=Persea americana TaxID=3435 RepID=A0ACC2L8S9_PERAE|nr:hypothetical protein MRB53_023212 [Persea americana]
MVSHYLPIFFPLGFSCGDAVVDGVQTLDHETDNEEDVKTKAVEKETEAEQGERNTEEHLNEPTVETRNDDAKNSGAVPMGFETARSPKKRDDGLKPPSLEKGGKDSPEVEDVGSEYGLVKAAGTKRPDGWVYRFPTTNTTILYYWSASLCYLEPLNITDPATDYAMHLDRPPTFLQRYFHRFNVLVLNTGHHWNSRGKLNANRWVMYVGGEPIRDRKLAQIGNAKNFVVYSVIKWCNTSTPLARRDKVSQDESDDSVVAGAVKGTGVRLLDITALSQLREEGHISRYSLKASDGVQDCLHWWLPGIPDTWNEILYTQLLVAD